MKISFHSRKFAFVIFLSAVIVTVSCNDSSAQQYNLGVGIYPGDPGENFSPSFVIDSVDYRNLALLRPTYQSSAYDFNLTSELITDGIITSKLPGWIVTTTSTAGVLGKTDRDWVLDRHEMSRIALDSSRAWLQVEMAGDYPIPGIDSIGVSGAMLVDSLAPKPWRITILGSTDGRSWQRLGMTGGRRLPGDSLPVSFRSWLPHNLRILNYSFRLRRAVRYRYYRCEFSSPNVLSWMIGEFGMWKDGVRAEVGGPYHFTSAWKSAGSGVEWVYVDLGAKCRFDRIKLFWIRRAAAGSVQVSDDAKSWQDIATLGGKRGNDQDLKLGHEVDGRYVRLLMTRPASRDGYILSEMQVFGTGGPVPVPHPQAVKGPNGGFDLSGGSWRIQRQSLVRSGGEELSESSYDDRSWPVATVPGTALVSYLNDGAIPDPNFADNQAIISDSYFYSDFWYRKVFDVPDVFYWGKVYLNFGGINWKAEVYMNGHALGRIDGAFIRGKFDISRVIIPGVKNVIAVRIIKNDAPGFPTEQDRYTTDSNGGELGADNPTFHASVGWDWMPTIRGRNTGIWSDVYISTSGWVSLDDPFVSATLPLPDTSFADLKIEATLHSYFRKTLAGFLQGKIGDTEFSYPVTLEPYETKTVTIDPSEVPSLRMKNPKLWWPNGYGEQNLYDVKLFYRMPGGGISDSKSFKIGIKEMTYSETDGKLKIRVNGRRFVARGGNWGFPESMLRYRSREYDIAVRYHEEMNFTMIRDWVGQTADDAFYDACDKYGIMVWQDFWLANPLDGPDPKYPGMFIRNADDFVKRIRNHPSIALFVGRNEGNPPPEIDSALVQMIVRLDAGILYIPNSASGVVSGGGPYRLMPVKFYFEHRATEKLHSELGMPAIVSYESLKRMMPDSDLWPQSNDWGVHDFTLEGAQNGTTFNGTIEDEFGKVDSLREWLWLADHVEYDGYRAMFEAQGRNRMGVLLWMTHPSWPSLVWQTYDYYFDPTAAYFGSKEACEPLHIQWNAYTDSVEVVNYSVPDGSGLTVTMELLNMDGTVKLKRTAALSCPMDSIVRLFPVGLPDSLTPVYFIRLLLTRGDTLVSRNFYWRELKTGDMNVLTRLPEVKLKVNTEVTKEGGRWNMKTTLVNETKTPAPLVKLKVVGEKDGRRILPAIYSDNFISLMPGERRTIETEVEDADTRGEKPAIVVEGMNVTSSY